jgi:acetylornithine deacetylase/succinyl-diaminopimelate desuccinylase-like protein
MRRRRARRHRFCGVSRLFADVDDVRAHGKDERLGVSAFDDGVEFTYRLMKALSR